MIEKKDVKIFGLAKELQGLNTIESICKKTGIKKKTAINYIYELRAKGLVKTERGRNKIRMYEISPIKKPETGYSGLYDIINAHSPIKVAKPFEHREYQKMSIKEAIARALDTKDFRTILAAMALFKHVNDWAKLYEYAKKYDVTKSIGALYDLSKHTIRIKDMDKDIEKKLLKAKQKNKFIIDGIKTGDFIETEKKWRVFVPFRKDDLRRLKE